MMMVYTYGGYVTSHQPTIHPPNHQPTSNHPIHPSDWPTDKKHRIAGERSEMAFFLFFPLFDHRGWIHRYEKNFTTVSSLLGRRLCAGNFGVTCHDFLIIHVGMNRWGLTHRFNFRQGLILFVTVPKRKQRQPRKLVRKGRIHSGHLIQFMSTWLSTRPFKSWQLPTLWLLAVMITTKKS